MKVFPDLLVSALFLLVASCGKPQRPPVSPSRVQTFEVKGTILELKPDGVTAVIQHEAISNYMAAMTMPFRARATNELAGLRAGDRVAFRLSVAEEASWIGQVRTTGRTGLPSPALPPEPAPPTNQINVVEGLSAFTFTNEFGQVVNFRQFRGQALGLTFIFTRCPLPEYCPRLTKNFVSATRKLEALENAPTNWHFFSISFDTEVDSPAVLRAYARAYGYDSNRWTFLTGSAETISTVARNFGFNYKREGGTFTHQFITTVLDANGHWHAAWPVGGDTSDNLVEEIVKAARVGK
jgi:protein SCO1/2